MQPALIHWCYAALTETRSWCPDRPEKWLAPLELKQLSHWRAAQRREAWLAGRALSKRLILEHFAAIVSEPAEIQILSRGPDGRGVKPCTMLGGRLQPWSLSISHTDRFVFVALCTKPGISVGVDLAKEESYHDGFLTTWFGTAERAYLRQKASRPASEMWAIKEAIYKAVNAGESFVPRKIQVYPGFPGDYLCAYDGIWLGSALALQSWRIDGHIAVLATLTRSAASRRWYHWGSE